MKIPLLVLSLVTCLCAFSQNTTRKHLKLKKETDKTAIESQHYDTITPANGQVAFYGFEKAQHSTTESFFVTNHTDSPLDDVNVTITYFDRNDRLLHSRSEWLKMQVPPHETRSVNIKSWDKQKLWYYIHTQARHNEYCTPFNVKIRLNYVLIPRKD